MIPVVSVTTETTVPTGATVSREQRAGYTPHVFAESEKVPWNQRVTKIQFLGVRKPLQAKGLQTIVDGTMAEILGFRYPFTHSSATVAPYPKEKR